MGRQLSTRNTLRRGALPPLLLFIALALAVPAAAGDWPQTLGPERNGTAADESLARDWPAGGPTRVWEVTIGSGYAGPAVVGDRVVLFHRQDDVDMLDVLQASDGRRIHRVEFPATYRGGVDPDTGPRCVPTIHEQVAYLWSAGGECHAVDLTSGATLWTRPLLEEFGGDLGYFGCGSAPIVAGDHLLINVGGRRSSGIVALELDSGRTAWSATDEQASYSAPVLNPAGGANEVVFVTRLGLLSIDAATGKVSARQPFGQRGPTVNAALPIWTSRDTLLVTASYGIGARHVRWTPDGWTTLWENPDVLSSQYNTPIYRDGMLLGIHGREDAGRAELRCVEAATGRVLWAEADFGVAHLLAARDRILALKVTGELELLEPSRERYIRLGSARISDHATRALPALSSGRLFARSNQGETGKLSCWLVGRE